MNKVSKIFLVIILLLIITAGFLLYHMLFWRDAYMRAAEQMYEVAQILENIENKYDRHMEEVTIEVIENTITPTGATIVITDNNKNSYMWTETYALQIEQDDAWRDVTPISEPVFQDILYTRNDENQIEQNIDWSTSYGPLPAGTYKIIKHVNTSSQSIFFDSNTFEIK